MSAVVCEDHDLDFVDLPDPVPGPRQVLLQVTHCGICGSDLHARQHADAQADILAETGYDGFGRSSEPVVYGHEFCGTVAAHGTGTRRKIKTGTPVVALPLIDLRFVVGYGPLEFRDTLHQLAEGTIDASPLVVGTVGLDGVATAFDLLGDPERHAKILFERHRRCLSGHEERPRVGRRSGTTW